jgi:hypothetical protein
LELDLDVVVDLDDYQHILFKPYGPQQQMRELDGLHLGCVVVQVHG